MYAGAHEDTQTLTVTKITPAPTDDTDTHTTKDCNLHLGGLEFGKSALQV